MFNKPKMIIKSTKLDLTAEPFLLVLLKRVLCSRCGLSSDKLPTKNGKNELKLFLGGIFYFQCQPIRLPYKFEKFDRAWAKSFNSFLLLLKFIRSRNVAMEHNVLQISEGTNSLGIVRLDLGFCLSAVIGCPSFGIINNLNNIK